MNNIPIATLNGCLSQDRAETLARIYGPISLRSAELFANAKARMHLQSEISEEEECGLVIPETATRFMCGKIPMKKGRTLVDTWVVEYPSLYTDGLTALIFGKEPTERTIQMALNMLQTEWNLRSRIIPEYYQTPDGDFWFWADGIPENAVPVKTAVR